MSFDENNLDKCLSELESKTKKLNFCKQILKSDSIFAIKTDDVDKDVVQEIESFIKENIKEHIESIITTNKIAKGKVLDDEEWIALKELINQVLKRDVSKNNYNKSQQVQTELEQPVSDALASQPVEDRSNNVMLITTINAIMESAGMAKESLPLDIPMSIIGEDRGYLRCKYEIHTADGQTRNVIFRVPAEDTSRAVQ